MTASVINTRLKSKVAAFLSPENVVFVVWKVGSYNGRDIYPINPATLRVIIPPLMRKFAETRDLDNYDSVTQDWLEELDFINMQFVRETVTQLSGEPWSGDAFASGAPVPDINVMRGKVGDKPISELDAEDMRNLDAFNYDVKQLRWNSNFARLNKIRGWEKQLVKRHYDYHDSEGFHGTDLEVPQRGFDMSAINEVSTSYTHPNPPAAEVVNPGYGLSRYRDPTPYAPGPLYPYGNYQYSMP